MQQAAADQAAAHSHQQLVRGRPCLLLAAAAASVRRGTWAAYWDHKRAAAWNAFRSSLVLSVRSRHLLLEDRRRQDLLGPIRRAKRDTGCVC